jgi:flagellar assembly factor FliW
MILSNTKFGDIEYSETDIVTFEVGLVGFPTDKRFLILNLKPKTPFRWLQCIDNPSLAFLVGFAEAIVPRYSPSFNRADANEIGITEESPTMILATVTIPVGKPDEMTINLAAPIVINGESMKAKQVILSDDAYTVRHRVFARTDRATEKAAA